jgi:ligand-binding SRPBCC domain-containing protein
MRTLDAEMWLPVPIEQVFAFFCEVANLDLLTPPWVHFETLTPRPIAMGAGTVIDHRLRIHGVPIRWQSEITVWQPPTQFVDEQRRGPYKLWVHRHDFVAEDGGTWIRDHVDYRPRGWICEALVDRWLVEPDLRRIFTFRHQRIREVLAPGTSAEKDRVATEQRA